jgi:hypothetical protein
VKHAYAGYIIAKQRKGHLHTARPELIWAENLDEAVGAGKRIAESVFKECEGWIAHACDFVQVPDEWLKKRWRR